MCIRDSTEGESDYDEGERIFIKLFILYPFSFYIFFREYSPCLLYTSDAADERSSVDLGGRRIIKKKNKEEKEESEWKI